MPELRAITPHPQVVNQTLLMPAKLPDLPDAIKKRFGKEAERYDEEMKAWWATTKRVLVDAYEETAAPHNEMKVEVKALERTLTTADATLSARITEETNLRVEADGALAEDILTIETTLYTETTGIVARVEVIEGAYVDENEARAYSREEITASIMSVADPIELTSLTQTAGVATATKSGHGLEAGDWVYVAGAAQSGYNGVFLVLTADATTFTYAVAPATPSPATGTITVQPYSVGAAVLNESTARVTADGYMAGGYKLTVTAGAIVTGMQLISASSPDPGDIVSEVAFQADKFLISSGTNKKVMFVADAVQDKVRLAGVFTVDGTASAIYIKTAAGAGSYNDANTAFFVDSNGRLSLKDKLTWDGYTLTVKGTVESSSGTIGGFTIGTSDLTVGSGATQMKLSANGIRFGQATGARTVLTFDPTGTGKYSYLELLDDGSPAQLRTVVSPGSVTVGDTGATRIILSSTGEITAVELTASGDITTSAGSFYGDGSKLSGLTKSQVGLGNVPNTDCTNASNISSGTIANTYLPSTLYKKLELNPDSSHGELGSGEESGVDKAFTTYLKIYANGQTRYIPFTTSLS